MKICLIAEGSYPYITGGVSSWIHSLITQMPEHEFILFTISASESQRGKFKYSIPGNLTHIQESFLDSHMNEQGKWGRRFRMSPEQKRSVAALLGVGGPIVCGDAFDLLRTKKYRHAVDYLMSKDYFDVLVELCKDRYDQVPFTELFWTVRSMMLPLILTIRQSIPEADLYHSVSTGYAGVVGGLARHLTGKPLLLTEHGIYSREREEEIIKADWVKGYFKDLWIEYFYRLSACAYGSADRVVSLFQTNKDIQIELGCPADKIEMIANGVHVPDYEHIERIPEDGVFRIGAIVRVVPIKDIKSMIQSFALIKREVPHAELLIMGPMSEDESYARECMQLVEVLQVEAVIFTGEVNVKEQLSRIDLLLLSSISEGQPLAILEGMAAGIPWVSTDVGSCKELLHGADDGIGPCGEIVPVMHYEQMAQAAIRLAKNDSLRHEMGRNGRLRASGGYTRRQFIDRYRALYERYNVAGSGGKGGARWRASDSN